MIRLRVIHSFLWYLMYGHPLRDNPTEALSASQSPAEPPSSDPGTGLPESQAKQDETSNPPPIDEGLGDEDGLQGDQSKLDQSDADMKGKSVSSCKALKKLQVFLCKVTYH